MSDLKEPQTSPEEARTSRESLKLPKDLITISVLSTVVLFGILLVKVYGVAHFNVDIIAVLVTASPSAVVLGIIAIYTYFFLAMIAITSGCMFVLPNNHVRYKNYRLLFLLVSLFFALLTPWRYLVDVIILTFVITALLFPVFRSTAFSWIKAFTASIVVIFMLLILATLDQPWLPAEVITLKYPVVTDLTVKGGAMSQEPVAYVLGEENGRLKLLVDEHRTVILIPEDIVILRQLCNMNTNPMGSTPIIGLLTGGKFGSQVLSCWRNTDQSTEQQKKTASAVIRWLEWKF